MAHESCVDLIIPFDPQRKKKRFLFTYRTLLSSRIFCCNAPRLLRRLLDLDLPIQFYSSTLYFFFYLNGGAQHYYDNCVYGYLYFLLWVTNHHIMRIQQVVNLKRRNEKRWTLKIKLVEN